MANYDALGQYCRGVLAEALGEAEKGEPRWQWWPQVDEEGKRQQKQSEDSCLFLLPAPRGRPAPLARETPRQCTLLRALWRGDRGCKEQKNASTGSDNYVT